MGRSYKTQILNWDNSVYSTVVTAFNGRDQAVSVKQYQGAETSSTFQEMTMTYDGHGRLKTRHLPQQDANTAAAYNYNADDSIERVVDARGASTNYIYNTRGLVGQISYAVPTGSQIPVTPTVNFTYDNIGNRTQMTDGLGTVNYEYNDLSQMTAETRQFIDTTTTPPLSLPNAPAPNNSFRLEYTYALSGQLASLKDPYGQQFNYAYDKIGRLTSVTGTTAFNGITTYANNPTYNARGTLTALGYGNGVAMAITAFNNKLQATAFEVKKDTTSIVKKDYQFYADGSLKFSKDVINEKFDRLYKYDNVGRTIESKSGVEARGGTASNLRNIPYSHQYSHDAFGNITQIAGRYYGSGNTTNYSFNNQNRNAEWTYDADGNTTEDADASYKYDAAGRTVSTTEYEFATGPTNDSYDGDGQMVKRVRNADSTTPAPQVNYYIRSSVLNKVVSETDGTGKKLKTFVPANGVTLATQELLTSGGTTTEKLTFIHQDASGASVQQTKADGTLSYAAGGRTGEYDALGRNVANASPYITLNTEPPGVEAGSGANLFGSGEGYRPGKQIFAVGGGYGGGIVVPQWQFMLYAEVDFGMKRMIERTTRTSVRDYSVKFNDGNRQYERFFGNEADARNFAFRMNQTTIFRNILVSDSWSLNWSLFSFSQQSQTREVNPFTEINLTEKDKTKLKDNLASFTNNKDCNKFITSMLEKMKSTGRAGYDTTNINKLFEIIFGNKNNNFYSVNYLEVWDKGLVKAVPYALTSFSNSGTPNKKTTIRFDSYYFGFAQGKVRGQPYPSSQFDATVTLVHELIHAFGNTEYFSHLDQARTAFATAQEMGIDVKAAPVEEDFVDLVTKKVNRGALDVVSSTYFGDVLKKACSGGK